MGNIVLNMKLIGFLGAATVSVDTKGRTNLPLEFRKQIAKSQDLVVVTIFADQSLVLRTVEAWNDYQKNDLSQLAKKDKIASRFVMKVTSMAKISELDKQNRISLSIELMQYANIKKEVTFAGDGSHIRLWAPSNYAKIMESSTNNFDQYFFKGQEEA